MAVNFLTESAVVIVRKRSDTVMLYNVAFKDGAYFCYCAHIFHILQLSKKVGFLNGGQCLLKQRHFCAGRVIGIRKEK